MRLSIPEILTQVVTAATRVDKIATLQRYDNTTLRSVLRLNFDPTVKLNLPTGPAPFKSKRDIPVELTNSNLYNEARRLYIFEVGHPKYNPALKQAQRENIWVQILEGIHHDEADMLNLVKDKKLGSAYKGLTEALVREAFPGLLTDKTK